MLTFLSSKQQQQQQKISHQKLYLTKVKAHFASQVKYIYVLYEYNKQTNRTNNNKTTSTTSLVDGWCDCSFNSSTQCVSLATHTALLISRNKVKRCESYYFVFASLLHITTIFFCNFYFCFTFCLSQRSVFICLFDTDT